MTSLSQELCKMDKIIKQSKLIEDGSPARYHLQTSTYNLDQSRPYRKITFGERDTNKPHKTILMVGETGTGKTTLINVMINYMLGVQREDKVWFEITDDQSEHRSSVHSQTSNVTVYGFYPKDSPIHLTIIDTPGYGDTRGIHLDKKIAASFLRLSESAEVIHGIHAVCLVIKATQNRLSDRLLYIFDAVQSLFGKDIAENIVLLFTHSDGARPKNALTAVKEAKIKCAENDENQPVFFLFNNRQSEPAEEEYETINEQAWNLSFRGMKEGLFKFLDKIQPKSLKKTQHVVQKRELLEANISNLKSRVEVMEQKQNELKQHQDALKQHETDVKNNQNFEYDADVLYKEKAEIDLSLAKVALCCTFCEENCHYPGCWWASNPYWCSMIKDDHCRVCSNKCHYSTHVKSTQIYVSKKKKEKKTYEALKKEYDGKIRYGESLIKKLAEELQELEKEKIKLVMDAFNCVEILQKIALNADSVFTLQNIDFLIERLKEINEPEKVKTLENIKKRAGEERRALECATNLSQLKKNNKHK